MHNNEDDLSQRCKYVSIYTSGEMQYIVAI